LKTAYGKVELATAIRHNVKEKKQEKGGFLFTAVLI